MKVYRHSLIWGLSYALDIAGKNNLSHSKSTAYLSVMLGRELGVTNGSGSGTRSLYYAALLHDIGISNAYIMEEHCKIGAEMLEKLPLPETERVPEIVRYHHEYYDGSGIFGKAGTEIPLESLIICYTSDFDDTFGNCSGEFAHERFKEIEAHAESKKALFPKEINEAFARLIKRESFLLDYFNHETKYALSQKIADTDDVYYGYDEVVKFARCFADIIDRRSRFTFNHSNGIAELARKSAAHLGYDSQTQNKMYIAGLLHDIGKLHVSTDILHKNGKLTPEERFEINKHTYFTRKILEQINGFEDIVEYAANHHEKLDGTGYPYRIPGKHLSELERIMAVCDVYQALTEERPYRDTLPSEKVWGIIDGMAKSNHLDREVVQKLKKVV